ncbi:MAG: hypothetical protein BJ554DRAFT_1956, partial [Olpidium bornovanus]
MESKLAKRGALKEEEGGGFFFFVIFFIFVSPGLRFVAKLSEPRKTGATRGGGRPGKNHKKAEKGPTGKEIDTAVKEGWLTKQELAAKVVPADAGWKAVLLQGAENEINRRK